MFRYLSGYDHGGLAILVEVVHAMIYELRAKMKLYCMSHFFCPPHNECIQAGRNNMMLIELD